MQTAWGGVFFEVLTNLSFFRGTINAISFTAARNNCGVARFRRISQLFETMLHWVCPSIRRADCAVVELVCNTYGIFEISSARV
jgi:hypothetical protein